MISGGYRCPLYDDDAAVTTTDLGSDQATRQLDSALGAAARWLTGQGVTHVAIEATGIYSMPVYHALIEHQDS